ncbi:MAG: TonB-dependent receptor [Labilithrix sp.]|nr:TonB-dependent receptor [Labilithrix sp.]
MTRRTAKPAVCSALTSALFVLARAAHAAPEETADAAPDTAPAPPVVVAPVPIEEVTVSGLRRQTSSSTEQRMKRTDIRLVPGAFGDPFRAIEAMPGVMPIVSGLPYYYVRGAPPSAVGYFIDDVRVPYLFHFALGPGVIQPTLIDEVSLHPAAFPARYGRYAGGVVAGQTREPGTELRGEGQIRIFDAGAYVEAPFAGGRGAAGIGGRYSYTAAILSLVSPNTSIDYRDYNARVSYELSDRWRATAFTFGSFDMASQVEDGVENVLFASEFHRLDLRFDRRGADGATSRVGMTLGLDRTRLDGKRFSQDMLVGVRARERTPIGDETDIELGIDATVDRYSGDLPSVYAVQPAQYAAAEALFSPRIDTATGAWASASWHPTKRFDLTATARADVFSSDGETAIGPSPRVSTRVPVSSKLTFLGAMGVGTQAPAFAIPVPAVGYRRLPGGLGYAYQKSAGAEVDLPLRFLFRAVGFHHSYFNLRDFARNRRDFDIVEPQLVQSSPAQAYGLEVHLSRRLSERFGGFVSYTLSRTEVGATQRTQARVSPFDRTHVLHVGGSADLGRGWRAGVRFLTYRGWPDEGTSLTSISPPSRRLPAFTRIDARIEKRWSWRKAGHIALVLEALNATASTEIIGRRCIPDEGCRDEELGPIVIPSLGVEGAL